MCDVGLDMTLSSEIAPRESNWVLEKGITSFLYDLDDRSDGVQHATLAVRPKTMMLLEINSQHPYRRKEKELRRS